MKSEWFWDLSNVVTGFYVAQMVLFQFMLADPVRLPSLVRGYKVTRNALLVTMILYVLGVIGSGAGMQVLEQNPNCWLIWGSTAARVIAISFYGLGIVWFFGDIKGLVDTRLAAEAAAMQTSGGEAKV